MFTCIMLNIIKVITVCVKFINFCVNSYYTLRYRVYYILRRKLLHFESLLHFASKSFTFNVTITFWVNYYIFWRKTVSAMTATNFTHQVARSSKLEAFPFTKNFGKFLVGIPRISVREESVSFVRRPIRLQAPLRRFTKKPDAFVNCSAIFSNASLFVAFP